MSAPSLETFSRLQNYVLKCLFFYLQFIHFIEMGLMYLLSLMNIDWNYVAAICVLVVLFIVANKYFLSARQMLWQQLIFQNKN